MTPQYFILGGALLLTSLVLPENSRIEATSLLGKPLLRPDIPADRAAKLTDDLERARADFNAEPDSEAAAIWYGRRLAYLGRYRDAIDVFSSALKKHPRSYRLLRHRGHRYITLRQFDQAIADLTRASELIEGVADEIEPDGAPNAKNVPRSTNHSNIWYHLALAHYLKGNFAEAATGWRKSLQLLDVNDDMRVSSSYWLYLALRRDNKPLEAAAVLAPIKRQMDVVENQAYQRLLLMFKGELNETQVLDGADADAITNSTISYGVGAWRLLNGDQAGALQTFRRLTTAENWAPFGYIAAEAELSQAQ